MADKPTDSGGTKIDRIAEAADRLGVKRGDLLDWLSDAYNGSQQQWRSWMNGSKPVSEKWIVRFLQARGDDEAIARFFKTKYAEDPKPKKGRGSPKRRRAAG